MEQIRTSEWRGVRVSRDHAGGVWTHSDGRAVTGALDRPHDGGGPLNARRLARPAGGSRADSRSVARYALGDALLCVGAVGLPAASFFRSLAEVLLHPRVPSPAAPGERDHARPRDATVRCGHVVPGHGRHRVFRVRDTARVWASALGPRAAQGPAAGAGGPALRQPFVLHASMVGGASWHEVAGPHDAAGAPAPSHD